MCLLLCIFVTPYVALAQITKQPIIPIPPELTVIPQPITIATDGAFATVTPQIDGAISSGYNYASGRLDHQTYFKSIRVDQAYIGAVVLDPILEAWIREAILVSDLLPLPVRTMNELPHQWFWDGTEHVDPAKEARAQETRLKNHTTTLAHEYARQGKDWETELRQRAREMQLIRELGLPEAAAKPRAGGHSPSGMRLFCFCALPTSHPSGLRG